MNSSLIHDEVLAHRLGLVPIKVDPRLFEFRGETEEANDANTLCFSLDVTCPQPVEGAEVHTKSVYASDLQWVPYGKQTELLHDVRPCNEDILIAKLRPGQVSLFAPLLLVAITVVLMSPCRLPEYQT